MGMFWAWRGRVAAWPNLARWACAVVLVLFLVGQLVYFRMEYTGQTLLPNMCCGYFAGERPRGKWIAFRGSDGQWSIDVASTNDPSLASEGAVLLWHRRWATSMGLVSPIVESRSNAVVLVDARSFEDRANHPERDAIIRAYATQYLRLPAGSPRLAQMVGTGRPTVRVVWWALLNDVLVLAAFVMLCGVVGTLRRPWKTGREKREAAGLCVRCGYEIAGLGTCPECGEESPRAVRERLARIAAGAGGDSVERKAENGV